MRRRRGGRHTCRPDGEYVASAHDSNYPSFITLRNIPKAHPLKLSDIFSEGSEARRIFGKFYAVAAILVILTVLVLLALATRGG